MHQRHVGRTGLRVSRLGLGTMTWGRDTDQHEARDQLTAFVEAGGNLVDTAAGYADGDSELVLGSLLGTVVPRRDLVIATKAGVSRDRAGGRNGGGPRNGSGGSGGSSGSVGDRIVDVSRRTLLADLDDSLRRLGTEYVDLWQVHAWSSVVPLEETLAALDLAVSTGRALYVGVCNYAGWQTARAATLQESGQGATLASTQVEYSLLQRAPEREVLPAARALGLGLFAWSPLGRGVLTGKYRHGTPADSRAASPHFERFVGAYLNDGAKRAYRIVDAVCRAADGLGLAPLEVALAWVRDRPGVAAPIVGARTAAQLRGSLTVEDVELPVEITAALDDVSST